MVANLGKCEVDWELHELRFMYNGRRATLFGERDLHQKIQTLQSASAETIQSTSAMEYWLCQSMQEEKSVTSTPLRIQKLLEEFGMVFANITGLPPVRGREHTIVLKQGTSPISVRSYIYPQVHKEAMTVMVNDILKKKIIQPSCSPFFNPMLLVKKKDKSWRFCVDYRALNQVTVVDPKIYTMYLIVIGSSIWGRNNVGNDILITQRYNQV